MADRKGTCPGSEAGIDESSEAADVREGRERTLVARTVSMTAGSIVASPPSASEPPVLTTTTNPVRCSPESPLRGSLAIELLLVARNSHVPPVRAIVRNARAMTKLRRMRTLYSRTGRHGPLHGASLRSRAGNYAIQPPSIRPETGLSIFFRDHSGFPVLRANLVTRQSAGRSTFPIRRFRGSSEAEQGDRRVDGLARSVDFDLVALGDDLPIVILDAFDDIA